MTPVDGGFIPDGRIVRARDEDHALVGTVTHAVPRDVVELRLVRQDGQALYAAVPSKIHGEGADGIFWTDQHEAHLVPPLMSVPRDLWDVVVGAIDATRPPRLPDHSDELRERLRDVEAQRDDLVATVGRLSAIIDRIGAWLAVPVPDYTPDVRPGRQDHDTATEGPTR